jgi:hypothetical protein
LHAHFKWKAIRIKLLNMIDGQMSLENWLRRIEMLKITRENKISMGMVETDKMIVFSDSKKTK